MTVKRLTIGLLIATGVVWIGWDVFLGASHYPTESMIIATWVRQANSLALFLGALVGHWCWQSRNPRYNWWPFAAGILALAVGWDLLCYPWDVKGAAVTLLHVPAWMRHPGLWVMLGLPVGHFFWPQRYPTDET